VPPRDDYCPVAKTVGIVGDRWCLLLVREMLRGVRRFNEFERSLPGISRSILAQRLRHLQHARIVRRTGDAAGPEYRLTEAGMELGAVIGALNDWGLRWLVPQVPESALDPDGLMLWVRRHVTLDELPPDRVVVGFELRTTPRRYYWLLMRGGEVSLCPEDPGFGEDLHVVADPAALYLVLTGARRLWEALDDGSLDLVGPRALVPRFASWFLRPDLAELELVGGR
jgi:DNA-binding HxlR family transcriptional regulator